jgi:predicted HTH transcriptional regulator
MKESGKVFVENSKTELKVVLNDKLEREVVAFLNYHEGGNIYIGIEDNGNVVGVEDIDDIQLKIINRIKNNILPQTLGLFDVVIEEIEGKGVINIIISSGTEKPYYIRSQGMSPTGCYIRVGSSAQPMPTALIDDIYARRTRINLGNMVSPRFDLSFEQLKIFYEEKGLMLNEQFKINLELMANRNDYNYVGYLLADNNGTSIKVAKYSGIDKVDLIENDEYGYCSLIKSTKNVLNKFEIENITKAKITSKDRMEIKLVDSVALREAIINAIVHNDYTREVPPLFEIFSDRIVITSYGGLVNGLSEEDFFECCSMPRNRQLMRVFKDVGLVEQLGSGMCRILKVYDKSVFEILPNFIKITFKFSDFSFKLPSGNLSGNLSGSLKQYYEKVLGEILKDPKITLDRISEQTVIPKRTVSRIVKELQETNKLKRCGSKKTGSWEIL